eukprot:1393431-Pyramimonas_sp.AAC.1
MGCSAGARQEDTISSDITPKNRLILARQCSPQHSSPQRHGEVDPQDGEVGPQDGKVGPQDGEVGIAAHRAPVVGDTRVGSTRSSSSGSAYSSAKADVAKSAVSTPPGLPFAVRALPDSPWTLFRATTDWG